MYIRRKIYAALWLLFCAVGLHAQTNFESSSLRELLTIARDDMDDNRYAAQNVLGYRYGSGTGGAVIDYKKAVYWYTKAAKGGNGDAMYNLALCYRHGVGVERDMKTAAYWFEMAAGSNIGSAATIIGKWYLEGNFVEKNSVKAARFFKDASFNRDDEGVGEAKYYYALCLAYGYGVQKDSTKALLWAKRAIEDGNYNTYGMLGRMYLSEESVVEVNGEAARYYYELGSQKNIAACQNNLGGMYEKGDHIGRDVVRAIEYYRRAARNNSVYGMANLARMCAQFDSSYFHANTAIYWYTRLLDRGHREYLHDLAKVFTDIKDYDSLMGLYETYAEKNDAESMFGLARIYAGGILEEDNYRVALEYIDRAIAIAPDRLKYLDYKGEILLRDGEIGAATRIWKYIKKKYPRFYGGGRNSNTPLNRYMMETHRKKLHKVR